MLNKLKLAPWRRAGCKRSRRASPASCPSRRRSWWFMISHYLRWLLFAISLCLHLVHKEIFRDIPFSTERGTPTMLTKSTWLLESCAISQQQHHSADREERSSKPGFLGCFRSWEIHQNVSKTRWTHATGLATINRKKKLNWTFVKVTWRKCDPKDWQIRRSKHVVTGAWHPRWYSKAPRVTTAFNPSSLMTPGPLGAVKRCKTSVIWFP